VADPPASSGLGHATDGHDPGASGRRLAERGSDRIDDPVEEMADLGVITSEELVNVIEEEAGEDIYRMSAVSPIEHTYFETPFTTLENGIPGDVSDVDGNTEGRQRDRFNVQWAVAASYGVQG
jgi:hypothetical protein